MEQNFATLADKINIVCCILEEEWEVYRTDFRKRRREAEKDAKIK